MTPAEDSIPIARPTLGEAEAKAAGRAILSGWVTQGPEVKAFEEEFAEFVSSPHGCAVSSCTAALHLALLAAGVGPGDEVIVPSLTFIATANAIRYCGGIPVFIDILPATYNLDPALLEGAITEKTKAILAVHQMGMPCDLNAILEIARRRSLPVIEDAACAIGSEIKIEGSWEKIGKPHGEASCFSFHPRKVLTTGDGGMLTTRNPEWDKKFRLLRQHGMSVPDTVRHQSGKVIFESYLGLGYNYRMTDIQGAVGREQLKRLPEIIKERRRLAERYRDLLSDISGLVLPEEPEWARSNRQSYPVRLPEDLDPREVMEKMLAQGVATRRGIMCAHREEGYASGRDYMPLPESEKAQDRSILIPLFPSMTEEDQVRVANVLKEACGLR